MYFRGLEGFIYSFWVIFFTITALVNIAFGIGVLYDRELKQRDNGKFTYFVNIWIWALATLLGGVFVAAIYWAIHHSILNPSRVPISKD